MGKFLRHHIHSVMSTRDAMLPIKTILDTAEEANEAASITDHGSIASWIASYNHCKANDIKPIFGVEAYINRHRDRLLEIVKILKTEKNTAVKNELAYERDMIKKYHHIVLLAKNEVGFHNLIQLANGGYSHGFYGKPTLTYDELFKLKEGIIVTTACLGSTVCQQIMNKEIKDAKDFLILMKEQFPDDLYLEVQANNIEEQRVCNKYLVAFSKKLEIPMCIGLDSHYLTLDWKETHQDLLLLQTKQKKTDVGIKDWRIVYETKKGELKTKKFAKDKEFRKGFKGEDIFVDMKIGTDTVKVIEEVSRVWQFTGEADYSSEIEVRAKIDNNHKELLKDKDYIIQGNYDIYDKIEAVDFDTSIKLPHIDDAEKKLTELVKKNVKELKLVNKEYVDRLKYELNVIKENGFATYFLILYDLLNWCKEHEIPLGAGRGCFSKDVKIRTKDGLKNINNINIGEQILTHKNKFQSVLNIFEYDLKQEDLLVINTDCSKKINGITKDHKIYAIKKQEYDNGVKEPKWIEAKNLSKDDYIAYYE